MADIFLTINNAQHGPYTTEQLQAWLQQGKVTPNTLAWREGMEEWQPLYAWPGMGDLAAARPQAPAPYRPPAPGTYVPVLEERGFRRLSYFLISLLAMILIGGVFALFAVLVIGVASQSQDSNTQAPMGIALFACYGLAALAAFAVGIWLGVKRLQNIGWHGALILLILVPVVGSFLGLALIALPTNFAQTKRLDGWAWFWIVLAILFVIAAILAAVTGAVTDVVNQQGSLRSE